MEYRKELWFAPRWVLACYYRKRDALGAAFEKDRNSKAMKEAWVVAIMMLGIMKTLGRGGWIQLVDPKKEATPDVRTAILMDGASESGKLQYQDVEVVTLTTHSIEPVEEFLKKNKLSKKKAYQADTVILCYIDKNVQTKTWSQIQKALAATNAPYDVYLLGKIEKDKHVYQLARVHPSLDHILKFDVEEEIKKDYGYRNTLKYLRSTKKTLVIEHENHEPF